jgi:hypothetical protein
MLDHKHSQKRFLTGWQRICSLCKEWDDLNESSRRDAILLISRPPSLSPSCVARAALADEHIILQERGHRHCEHDPGARASRGEESFICVNDCTCNMLPLSSLACSVLALQLAPDIALQLAHRSAALLEDRLREGCNLRATCPPNCPHAS